MQESRHFAEREIKALLVYFSPYLNVEQVFVQILSLLFNRCHRWLCDGKPKTHSESVRFYVGKKFNRHTDHCCLCGERVLNSLAVMGDVERVNVERRGSEPVEAFKPQRQTHPWRDIFFDLVKHRLLLRIPDTQYKTLCTVMV